MIVIHARVQNAMFSQKEDTSSSKGYHASSLIICRLCFDILINSIALICLDHFSVKTMTIHFVIPSIILIKCRMNKKLKD